MMTFYKTPDFEIPVSIVVCIAGAVLFFMTSLFFALYIIDIDSFETKLSNYLKRLPLLILVVASLFASAVVGSSAVRDIRKIHIKKTAMKTGNFKTVSGYVIPLTMGLSKFDTYSGTFLINDIKFIIGDDPDTGLAYIPMDMADDFCSKIITVEYTEYNKEKLIISIIENKSK